MNGWHDNPRRIEMHTVYEEETAVQRQSERRPQMQQQIRDRETAIEQERQRRRHRQMRREYATDIRGGEERNAERYRDREVLIRSIDWLHKLLSLRSGML